ncbi:MAG: glycosyltransferase family 4 protein [Paludibacteraceae bacterium]|nr:glycosyltransferase family 4 protein [Paludibacteraceae bacterium]
MADCKRVVVTGTRGIPNIMGGVETHCEELFPLIAQKGYAVTIIRRSNYVKDSFSEWNGVQLVNVSSPKKKSFEAIVHTFRAINKAKNLGADVLHLHAIGPALLVPYAKLKGMKVVFTHHGPDYDRDKWGFFAKTMLKLGERMGCMFADEVIVISNVIRRLIADKYGRTNRVHLIYNGVPDPDFVDYPDYFTELGVEPENYILGMCRFVPEKNLHHLVEAYSLFKERHPESGIRLVLAGDTDFEDDYSRSLKKLAKSKGVVLTGFIKGRRLHSLLTHASCFVLPSSHEGLPIALLEAMSYRLPVVVSDIPANLEVELPEENYFRLGDVNQLSSKLECLLEENPALRVQYDLDKYQWKHIADQVCEVYASLG